LINFLAQPAKVDGLGEQSGRSKFRCLFGGGLVAVEVGVLLLNGWRCPLTSVAARYTDERSENFDIYLPLWLAKYNKSIFGTLYVAGIAFALVRWARA